MHGAGNYEIQRTVGKPHKGEVLCLQFDDTRIITGSNDATFKGYIHIFIINLFYLNFVFY